MAGLFYCCEKSRIKYGAFVIFPFLEYHKSVFSGENLTFKAVGESSEGVNSLFLHFVKTLCVAGLGVYKSPRCPYAFGGADINLVAEIFAAFCVYNAVDRFAAFLIRLGGENVTARIDRRFGTVALCLDRAGFALLDRVEEIGKLSFM